MWGDIAIAFMLAFITTFVVTPYTIRLAKKVGAIDNPKDERRVNTTPMPRLRGISCTCWFCGFCNIFNYSNEYRRYYKYIWRGYLLAKVIRIWNRDYNYRSCLLYR